MKTVTLPTQPDAKSPAGADIRFLIDGETGNMIHREQNRVRSCNDTFFINTYLLKKMCHCKT